MAIHTCVGHTLRLLMASGALVQLVCERERALRLTRFILCMEMILVRVTAGYGNAATYSHGSLPYNRTTVKDSPIQAPPTWQNPTKLFSLLALRPHSWNLHMTGRKEATFRNARLIYKYQLFSNCMTIIDTFYCVDAAFRLTTSKPLSRKGTSYNYLLVNNNALWHNANKTVLLQFFPFFQDQNISSLTVVDVGNTDFTLTNSCAQSVVTWPVQCVPH